MKTGGNAPHAWIWKLPGEVGGPGEEERAWEGYRGLGGGES